jgi:predicted RNA-binding protein (virulence factor B family)
MSVGRSRTRSAFHDLLGQIATLQIQRFGGPGAFLSRQAAAQDAPTILLLGPEIPEGAREGDLVDVFVMLDSEGRPLATTKMPRVTLGEVAFLRVTATTEFGAFVDWGLDKELLVPFAEQTCEMRTGTCYAIGLYVDNSDRLAGTMRVREMLEQDGRFHCGEWVEGEAWREEPAVGLFVIVERRFVGLVPKHEPHGLAHGEAARFRVAHVHPDGKIELSVRGLAHEEIDKDARRILEVLCGNRAPSVSERADAGQIRALFGLSKKAFKRAVGALLKSGKVDVGADGSVRVLKPES